MAQRIAYFFGALLAILGIWGFIQDPILGIFDANSLHSAVYLVSGATLLAVASWRPFATSFCLKIVGCLYAILAILGFSLGGDSILGLLDNSVADNVLHVLLGLVFLYGGFFTMESTPEDLPLQSI